jgi:hypothetical protein
MHGGLRRAESAHEMPACITNPRASSESRISLPAGTSLSRLTGLGISHVFINDESSPNRSAPDFARCANMSQEPLPEPAPGSHGACAATCLYQVRRLASRKDAGTQSMKQVTLAACEAHPALACHVFHTMTCVVCVCVCVCVFGGVVLMWCDECATL